MQISTDYQCVINTQGTVLYSTAVTPHKYSIQDNNSCHDTFI